MKVYKLKETEEPGVVIINIKGKIPESLHQIIGNISGDIFFSFPESITKTIDPDKFSHLYGATWYGIYKNGDVCGTWEILDYLETITNYTSISVINGSFWINDEVYKTFRKLQYSGIETSVFGSRELTKEEKEKIYVIPPKILELIFGWRIRIPRKKNNLGKYCRKTTSDQILFLRPSSVREIREKISPEILHSFSGFGVGSFLASIIPEKTYINIKVDEAKV